MSQAAGAPSPAKRRAGLPALAVLLAAAAAIVTLVRLPAAIDNFDTRASFNAHQSSVGREIAAADLLDIDNEFLIEALQLVPRGSTFAVLVPPSAAAAAPYGISPTTMNALPAYLQNLLLPSRMVDPAKAQYLLCYACNTDPYDPRMTRLWQSPQGFVIGKLRR